MTNTPDYEFIRQLHEFWLVQLEALAVQAIASNDWDAFYAHVVNFQNQFDLHGETRIAISKNLTVRFLASTDSLDGSGADLLPTSEVNERKELINHVTTARINTETAGVDGLFQSVSDNAAHP